MNYLPLNRKKQFFANDGGRIIQGFWDKKGGGQEREFAYIHLQKRSMKIVNDVSKYDKFLITSSGFEGIEELPKKHEDISFDEKQNNRMKFRIKKIKTFLRYYRKMLFDRRLKVR